MTDEKPVRCGCGGEAKVIMLIPEVYAVECSKCYIRTGSPATTETEAITAWNKAMGANRYKLLRVAQTAKVENIVRPHGYPAEGNCGNCGDEVNSLYEYCPYCGARLEWE